jgi:crotonobetainyl-CoA:carnitine CoA-transferase CaiB-like acyl-CoA transferase
VAGRAPLDGVRIVAIEQYGVGPYGTLYLADMGAFGVPERRAPSAPAGE